LTQFVPKTRRSGRKYCQYLTRNPEPNRTGPRKNGRDPTAGRLVDAWGDVGKWLDDRSMCRRGLDLARLEVLLGGKGSKGVGPLRVNDELGRAGVVSACYT